MKTRAQATSDPLPYVQVDRSVLPAATMLANAMGCSPQHALGSLIGFWNLCGDPRELERIIAATPDGQDPAVILSTADALGRFHLASGHEVQAVTMVAVGILAEVDSAHVRIRGMSRYFSPIIARLKARELASAGGKASARSRAERYGSAQPGRSAPGSGSGSTPVRDQFGAGSNYPSNPPSNSSRTAPEQQPNSARTPPNPSGQRSAVSGQDPEATATRARAPARDDQPGEGEDERKTVEVAVPIQFRITDDGAEAMTVGELPPDEPEGRRRKPGPEELVEVWNHETARKLRAVRSLDDARRKSARAALKRRPIEGEEGWRDVFRRLAAGAGADKAWADFDFAIRDGAGKGEMALKILEGKYDHAFNTGHPRRGGAATEADRDWNSGPAPPMDKDGNLLLVRSE